MYRCPECDAEMEYHEQDLEHGEHHVCPDCGYVEKYGLKSGDYEWCVVESKGNIVYVTCQRCGEKHVFDNANMTIDRFVEISKAFCCLHKNCKEGDKNAP